MHSQKHLHQQLLHSKFFRMTTENCGPRFQLNFTKAGGMALSLLPSDAFLASPAQLCMSGHLTAHPSSPPAFHPKSLFSRLLGLLASYWVWLIGGREKPEYFFPSLPILVAVAASALVPDSRWAHCGLSFCHVTLVPCLCKHHLLPLFPALSLGRQGHGFPLLHINLWAVQPFPFGF